MDENRIEGGAQDLGGKLQDAAGDFATQVRGKVNQVADQTQQAYGQAVDEVRGFTNNQPVTALVTAMGLGVVLGFLLGRR